jgi:hypothetical protein
LEVVMPTSPEPEPDRAMPGQVGPPRRRADPMDVTEVPLWVAFAPLLWMAEAFGGWRWTLVAAAVGGLVWIILRLPGAGPAASGRPDPPPPPASGPH